ncbi:MAG: discoidin domain-containing protein [Abditibacteriota bacterium]|nr:discoidin domain-containing protein [Abditibacteriota bacterium]
MKYYLIVLFILLSAVPIFAEYAKGDAPFVNTWLVLGAVKGDFDSELIQGQPTLAEEIQGKKWEYLDDRLFSRNLDDYVDLFSYYRIIKKESIDGVVAYLHTFVYSPEDTEAQIRYGGDRFSKVFLNGELVASAKVGYSEREHYDNWSSYLWKSQQDNATKDTVIKDVMLKKGWNSVLVKVGTEREQVFGLYFRISDKNGNKMDNISYSLYGPLSDKLSIDNTSIKGTDKNMPTAFTGWTYVGAKLDEDFEQYTNSAKKELWESALSATDFSFTASGGVPPYSFYIKGNLPKGLGFKDGVIYGKVDEKAKLGDYSFTVTVKDSKGDTVHKDFSITLKERPNKWIEAGRLTALIHAPEGIPAEDVAKLPKQIKREGYTVCMPISYNNGQYKFRFPNILNTRPEYDAGDVITPIYEAFKKEGVNFGMYVGNVLGNPHCTYDMIPLLYEDMCQRYELKVLWHDWLGVDHASVDAIYSLVKTINPDTVIINNGLERYTNGDWDVLCIEDLNTFANPENLWEGRFPYNYGIHYFKPPYNWPKNYSLETWKYIREKSEKYPKVTDWVDYLKTTIAINSDGGITNLDHSWVNEFGYSTYLKSAHEKMANWCNGKYVSEPLYNAYTNCYPLYDLSGDYGYANVSVDGKSIYLIFTENPRYKKGLKACGEYLTLNDFPGEVVDAKCININVPVKFTQEGKTLTLRVAHLEQDKIATIVKLSLKKPIEYESDRHELERGTLPVVIKKGNIAFGKPSKLMSNDGLRELEPSSFSAFAFNGNDGRSDTVAAGAWEWNWTYELDLEKVEKFGEIKVYFGKPDVEDGHGFATDFAIRVSKDKVNWTEIAHYENPEGKKVFDIVCKDTEARYICIDGFKPDGEGQFGGQMSIAELEIYK